MFANYFKIALRTLLRSKAYSLINIVGLALGMAAVLLIAMFVRDELSFDGFHANKDTIYRTIYQWKTRAGKEIIFAMNEHKLAPLLKQDFPEAKEICRIGQYGIPVRNGEKVFQEDNFFVADANRQNVPIVL
jgi:putative ABC transport system permease protein